MRRVIPIGAALIACCSLLAACGQVADAGPTVTAADFAGWEADLLRHGRLRQERDPADAPVSNAALVEHFGRIAFGLEAAVNRGRAVHRLHRRETPVRWWVFASGPEARDATSDVSRTFARFAALTRLDMNRADSAATADFHVLFLRPEDYDAAVAWARKVLGREDAELVAGFRTRQALCTGSVVMRGKDGRAGPAGEHRRALVLIRAGYSDLLRLGCVEEEIAQALGLANDDPTVRPSVFNDDEEFALLTGHDELLMRILYDSRLRAGMTADEAMPLVRRIVEELRPGG